MSDLEYFLIWSIEHNMWWRPDSHGYTSWIKEAGRYERPEAEAIVRGANAYGQFNECMIPWKSTDPERPFDYDENLNEVQRIR